MAENSVEEDNYISETMAGIYVLQGYFDKAIEIYNKLILKYPNKNTYFAEKINKVKQKKK